MITASQMVRAASLNASAVGLDLVEPDSASKNDDIGEIVVGAAAGVIVNWSMASAFSIRASRTSAGSGCVLSSRRAGRSFYARPAHRAQLTGISVPQKPIVAPLGAAAVIARHHGARAAAAVCTSTTSLSCAAIRARQI